MKLNAFQRIFLKHFADGEYADLLQSAEANGDTGSEWAIQTVTDLDETLARFWLIELSDEASCHNAEDAHRRLERHLEDIQKMLAVIESEHMADGA